MKSDITLKNDDKSYLNDLLLNLKKAQADSKSLTFKIVAAKQKGFVVKVGGLFAYVHYSHFSWSYPTVEFWHNISEHFVGKLFRGKIHKITEAPLQIFLDAKGQNFKKPNLQKYETYRCMIVEKSAYGVFVDLGFHFQWRYGSLLGLIHKSCLINPTDYNRWQVAQEITTCFLGLNKKGQFVLGDNIEGAKWENGAMEKLIGSVQKTKVLINADGRPEFYVLAKHKAVIPISKEFYPNFREMAKQYVNQLKDGESITCEIVKISKKRDRFILKLLIGSTNV